MQDSSDWTPEGPERIDPGFDAVPPNVELDTGLEQTLSQVDDVDDLVDEVIADLPHEPTSPGPFQEMPGGGVTQDLLGFLNGQGGTVSGAIDDVIEDIERNPELGQAPEGATGDAPRWVPPLPDPQLPGPTPDLSTIDPGDFGLNGMPYPGDPSDPGYYSHPGSGLPVDPEP